MNSELTEFWRIQLRVVVCLFLPLALLAKGISAQEPNELPIPIENGAGLENVAADVAALPLDSELSLDDGDFETLTRGPLHEAFAEPIVADPVPGLIIAVEPPQPIKELMPEMRPDGDDAIWIAGYWGWDEQREDFIWISGVYRVPPFGHQWVPGYWHQVADGWQWVQGFWVEDIAESIAYLPPPPATLENGPSSPSPGVDYFYIPGNWSQSSNGFAWSAGYWHPMQDDLVWVPSHTVWTPRGCVYVAGYWDQRLPLRGLCFAPVSVSRVTYSRPGWYYRPNVVLNSQIVLQNLFVQPGYNHYLFGDYYGLPPAHRHVVPAYVYHQRRGSCDPLISFYSAYNARQGQDMIRWYGNHYTDLNRNPEKRPAHNWSPAVASGLASKKPFNEPLQLAISLDQVNKASSGIRVSPITENFKRDNQQRDSEHKQLAKNRELSERKGDARGNPTLALPKSEITNRRNDAINKIGKLPEAPRSTLPNPARNVPPNNDSLNPLGRQLQEATRRTDLIPRTFDNKRETNRDVKPLNPNETNPQSGRILTPNQPRPFDAPRRPDVPRSGEPNRLENSRPNRLEPNRIEPNKPNRLEPNRLEPNRFDPNRIKEPFRRIEPPKNPMPNPQQPLGTQPSIRTQPPPLRTQPSLGNRQPSPEPRNRLNNLPNNQSEPRSTPFAPAGGSTSSFKPPVLPQPRRQDNPPAPRPGPPPQTDRQLRLGNGPRNDNSKSAPNDAGKKTKQ